jgi:Fur family ferric uptake transcriptional regulator
MKLDARNEFERYVCGKGMRWTPQRRAIVETFLDCEKHLTVEELYRLVRKTHNEIGYTTVFRTVGVMLEAGICGEVAFDDGSKRYEHKYGHEHHDHLICLGCGRVEEISSSRLERLQEALVKKAGYLQERHRLEIFGWCPKCRKKRR